MKPATPQTNKDNNKVIPIKPGQQIHYAVQEMHTKAESKTNKDNSFYYELYDSL